MRTSSMPAIGLRSTNQATDSVEITVGRRFLALTTFAAFLSVIAIGSSHVCAQEKYPSRPVKIVVSLPAGSSPDIRTRIVAEGLTKVWGRQVVVENRPGGGGLIGAQAVLSAAADGYTLLVAPGSTFTVLPAQNDKLPIDANRDLLPIGLVASESMLVAVSPKLGVSTFADLIALANREPHKIIIGTNPAGTLPHLAARLLVELSKAPMTPLPYATGGTNEAIRDVMGGHIHAVIEGRAGLRAALDSGDLRALATMSSEPHPMLPNVPIAAGTVPGLVAIGWQALFAPKGTPLAIVQQLGDDLGKALNMPDVRSRIEHTGTPFRPIFSAELVRFIESEQRLWWPIVKTSGLK
jgi:tripartite-type tricarboxylate transporter receptor subunit TctC